MGIFDPFFDRVRRLRRTLAYFKRQRLLLREELDFPMGATLCVEISGCNLKCAMCPRGGVHGLVNGRSGRMDLQLFRRILAKFLDEKVGVAEIWFANWGEPLLNPDFPAMAAHARALLPEAKFTLFTNLTCLPDPEAVAAAGLDLIEVSLSGMTQATYARNHAGGDLSKVLANLDALAAAKKRRRSPVEIAVKYHQYVYNRGEEAAAEKLCLERGFTFKPTRCYISSVEGCASFAGDPGRFESFYSGFIDLGREKALARTLKDPRKCILKRGMVTVDFDGRLFPCCGVYEEKNLMCSIFDVRIADIPELVPDICRVCAATPISWR